MNSRRSVLLVISGLMAIGAAAAIAGDLTPPAGPVLPTMKPLDEVEPRIAINAVNTPGAGNSQFRITNPGSYYLTGNLQGIAGSAGIEIVANNVTIDLCGFTMVGVPGSGSAMFDTGLPQNITIRNGIVDSWGGGVSLGNSSGVRIEDLTVRNCTGGGIEVGTSGIITRCAAIGTGGNGIAAITGATITDCVANQNAADGIDVGGGCVVSRCSAGSNAQTGIRTLANCVVSECSAFSNTFNGINLAAVGSRASNCSSFGNTLHGILTSAACVVENCSSRSNTLDGIRVTDDCVVRDNACSGNGFNGDGAGIVSTGFDNRIEGNTCTDADRGIQTLSGGNFITRNICTSNTSNWNITIGNVCLVVSAAATPAFNGNAGGVAPGSTDPNANFSY